MMKLIGILASVVALIVGLISVYVFWDDYFKPIKQHKIRWEYYEILDDPYPGAPGDRRRMPGAAPPDENVIAESLHFSVWYITYWSHYELIGECRVDKTKTPYIVQAYLKEGESFFVPPTPSQLGKRVKKGCSVSSIGIAHDPHDPFKVTTYYFECCWVED